MKHLKSSLRGLRELFDRSVSVKYIAEPFISFDAVRLASEVRDFMEDKDFDVVGVRRNGLIVGYVERAQLCEGTLEQHLRCFEEQLLLDESSSILGALQLLAQSPRIFVRVMGKVWAIVTKGDLQKAPVRMWLFGIVSLIEMQFLRLIRAVYPQESWKSMISKERLDKARQLLEDRQRRNEAIDLADCLQFADKRTIILKTAELHSAIGFTSSNTAESILEELEQLRNELAHAQDIITGRWPGLVDLAKKAEQILEACEECEPQPTS